MDVTSLQPGDRVIDLASLARTAGMLSGMATGVPVTWLAAGGWVLPLVLGVAGAGAGRMVGYFLGRLRYAQGGKRVVAKRGVTSLQATLNAALSSSVTAAITVWLGCLTVLGGPAPSLHTGAICLLVGIITGVALGVAACRP